jgi:hypothetical protein
MMQRWAAASFVALTGCGAPPAPVEAPPAATTNIGVATTEPEPSIAPTPEAPTLPTAVVEPDNVACRVAGKGWSDELRLRLASKPFARAVNAPATYVLPVTTTPSETIVAIDDGQILMRGVLPANDVGFYLPKPTALLGIVTPDGDSALGWVSSKEGSVLIDFGTDSILLTPQPFQVDLKCQDLAIVPGTYLARASITKQKLLASRDVARDGVEILPSPKATPSGTLRGGLEVQLLTTKGADARILIESHGFVVSGWVAKKDLIPPAGQVGAGFGKGGPFLQRHSKFYDHLTHCAADVDLFIEQGTERMKVGLIHKEVEFHPEKAAEASKPAFVNVEVPGSNWYWLEKDVRLVVERSSIEKCRTNARGF